MKVKDLIQQLQDLNKPEQEVRHVNEYEGTLDPLNTVLFDEDNNSVVIVSEAPDDE